MKKLLLSIFVFLSTGLTVFADNEFTLVADNGETAPVSNVSFLLAADNDTEFSVVLKEGEPILNVTKVTFTSESSGIVTSTREEDGLHIVSVNSELTLTGCRAGSRIAVYNEAGMLVKSIEASSSTATVNVVDLIPGLYILNASGTSVKFMKK